MTNFPETRNADPNDMNLPEPVRGLDRKMCEIGFKIDLGSFKNGDELREAVNCFVDRYQWELRQVDAFDRRTGKRLEGYTTLYGK